MSSSANSCLSVPELMERIVSEVADDIEPQSALYSLARVSRSFSTHALDKLWRDVKDLDAFICILPEGLVIDDDDDSKVCSVQGTHS